MANDLWQTPQRVFDYLNNIFEFEIDLAASDENALCNRYYDERCDALTKDWTQFKSCFCNPPWSRGNIAKFLQKAWESSNATNIVCLVLLDTVGWTNDWIYNKAEVWIPTKRIAYNDIFGKRVSPMHASQIVIYGPKAVEGKVKFIKLGE